MVDNKPGYSAIVHRKVAILSSFFGLCEVLVATFTIICGFVMLGGFCENLDCDDISKGVGLWLGFPLLIPGILGLVVLGTRHIQAVNAFIATNVIVLIFSIVHAILVFRDNDDFWNDTKNLYDDGKCSALGANKCQCINTQNVPTNLKFYCELVEFGFELNWILFGASIATMVLCVFGTVTGIVGRAMASVLRRNDK